MFHNIKNMHSRIPCWLWIDNLPAYGTNEIAKAFETFNRNSTYLVPSTTPLTQPVDIQIDRAIKANIKNSSMSGELKMKMKSSTMIPRKRFID